MLHTICILPTQHQLEHLARRLVQWLTLGSVLIPLSVITISKWHKEAALSYRLIGSLTSSLSHSPARSASVVRPTYTHVSGATPCRRVASDVYLLTVTIRVMLHAGGYYHSPEEYANKKGDLMQPCNYHDDIGLVTEPCYCRATYRKIMSTFAPYIVHQSKGISTRVYIVVYSANAARVWSRQRHHVQTFLFTKTVDSLPHPTPKRCSHRQ